jgi:hypothetical protein
MPKRKGPLMPIRREFMLFYGPKWRAYRRELILRRGSVCSVCGREVSRYLNLVHLTHDPLTSAVALMCAADHNRHDAAHRLAIWRRIRARRNGQLWLLPEIEQAPAWNLPRLKALQERLF